jgi:hypothetical protein
MKTLITIIAYCYLGRWFYLEACLLLPQAAPYFDYAMEYLEPPTHDQIISILNSYTTMHARNNNPADQYLDYEYENFDASVAEILNDNNQQVLPEDYF